VHLLLYIVECTVTDSPFITEASVLHVLGYIFWLVWPENL